MKKFWTIFALVLVIVLCLTACQLPFTEEKHEWSDWQVDVEPTCQHRGMKIRICEDCGEEQTRSLDAVEHQEVAMADVPATCVQEGQTGGTHCSMCGEVFTQPQILPKTGHDYSKETIVTPATCKAQGTKEISCVHCGDYITQSIPQTSHDYSKETIVTPATCSTQGSKRVSCVHCGDYITKTFALEPYSATEINKQALQYVGEILVFNKQDETIGVGTGFVYTADGRVITNYHVIDGAYAAQITINGETYEIDKVLAYDANIDLAVLKIDGSNMPHATICSKTMEVGSTVYAVGSSRGMTNTFSQGIITYFDRQVEGVSHIQHDASITNGNSGGPLVNSYGEVIGVNSWMLRDSQNLNFAVFIKELNNLKFGKSMTMAELYNSTVSAPINYLKSWVQKNYNYHDEDDLRYDEDLAMDGDDYYFSLGYDMDDNFVYADLLVIFADGSELYVALDFDADPTEYFYYADYTDTTGHNTTYGTINAKTFTENTKLTYISSEGGNWSESSLLDMYHTGMLYVLAWMDLLFEDMSMPVTIADLGFTQLV